MSVFRSVLSRNLVVCAVYCSNCSPQKLTQPRKKVVAGRPLSFLRRPIFSGQVSFSEMCAFFVWYNTRRCGVTYFRLKIHLDFGDFQKLLETIFSRKISVPDSDKSSYIQQTKNAFPPPWLDLCGLTEDGKYLSNTYALEHGMNWTGILIEPLTEEVGKFVGKLDPRPWRFKGRNWAESLGTKWVTLIAFTIHTV